MLGACAALLARGGFLAVATPLLLAGSVFHEVAVRLQVQSSNSFRYALMEFGAATEAQIMADGSLQKAVADQTVADELGVDSARQEGVAAEEEAAAGAGGEESATANEAAVEAASEGDALAVSRAAGTGDLEAGLAEAVKESAAKSAAKVASAAAAKQAAEAAADAAVKEVAAAAAAEGGAAAEGAAGADLAADAAVVDEAAEAAAIESGGLAAPAAGLVIAGTAAAAEAPGAIAAVEGEWGAASAEIQAARDEVVATEKQVEAEALEAGSAVYEEGSLAAGRAAAASAAAGVASLAASQGFHLLALAVQAPVALVVLHQKCGSAALALGGVGAGPPGGGHATAVGAAANVLLAASLGLVLGGPWARTVIAAAFWEADYFDFSSLPETLRKVMPHLEEHKKHNEQREHRGNKTSVQEISSTRRPIDSSTQRVARHPVDTTSRPASAHEEKTSSTRRPAGTSTQRVARHPADTTSKPASPHEEKTSSTRRPADTSTQRVARHPVDTTSKPASPHEEPSSTTQAMTSSPPPTTSRSSVLGGGRGGDLLGPARSPAEAAPAGWLAEDSAPASVTPVPAVARDAAAPGWEAPAAAPAGWESPAAVPTGWEGPAEPAPVEEAPQGWDARRLWGLQDFTHDVISSGRSGFHALAGGVSKTEQAVEGTVGALENNSRVQQAKHAVQGTVGALQNNSEVQRAEQAAQSGIGHAASGAGRVAEIVGHGAEGAFHDAEQAVEPGLRQAVRNGSEGLKDAGQRVQGVLATGSAVAKSAEHDLQETVNKSPVVREAEKLADNASRHVAGAVKTAGVAARNATMKVAKKVLVPPANTATTSVAPLTTGPPPEVRSSWSLFAPALARVGESVLHWVGPVLADLALVSLAFVACELAVSSGRHYRSSHRGHTWLFGCMLHDVSAKWMQGMGLLVAVWLLSIILASKLRPFAEAVTEYTDGSLGIARFLLGGACCGLCAYQAHLLSRVECEYEAKRVEGVDGEAATYRKLVTDEEQPDESPPPSQEEQFEEQSQAFSQPAEQPLLEQERQEEEEEKEEQRLSPRDDPEDPEAPQRDPEEGQPPPEPAEQRPVPATRKLQEVELPPWQAEEARRQQEQPLEEEAASAGRLCMEVSCLGAAVASAAGSLLAMAEAPMASWAMASSVKSTFSSKWLMSILPWSLVVEHVLTGWPPFLVSSPWPLLALALLVSCCLGFLLALARHGEH